MEKFCVLMICQKLWSTNNFVLIVKKFNIAIYDLKKEQHNYLSFYCINILLLQIFNDLLST